MMQIRNIPRVRATWLGVLAAWLMMTQPVLAGVNELTRDLNRTVQSGDQITMVIWMPTQFWDEALKASAAALPEEARLQMLAMLEDYSVFGVLRGKIGAGGLSEMKSKEELLKNLKLESNGKAIEPLAPEAVGPGAQMLLGQIKPAMASLAGPMGKSIEFVVYPAKAGGKLQIDAAQPGKLKVTLYDQAFEWRLPLGSLLPPRFDSKTGEEFPGNYEFNPYTGQKLGAKP
jgi:hypothetical protein